MLRNFTAALIATALVAGPALAAQPASDAGAAPAAAAPANLKAQAATKATDARTPGQDGQARADTRPPSRRPCGQARQDDQDYKTTKATKTVKSSA